MSRRRWTAAELAELARRYPNEPTGALAQSMGVSEGQVYGKAYTLGITKSAAYLASPASFRIRRGDKRGKNTRFQPGQTPWNKGAHYAAGGRSAQTRFKPGELSGRALDLYQPIGTERLSKDGYRQRKINDDYPTHLRWRAVHIIEWEAINGPLPKGHALVFRDGNKQNCAPDNMELITRIELMRRNSIHNHGPEIAKLVQLRGAITRQINRRSKNVG